MNLPVRSYSLVGPFHFPFWMGDITDIVALCPLFCFQRFLTFYHFISTYSFNNSLRVYAVLGAILKSGDITQQSYILVTLLSNGRENAINKEIFQYV